MRSVCLLLLLLPLAFLSGPLRGQDVHFSQINVNPVLFNPAYTGFFDGNARVGLVYRNQWVSVSQPFQTLALSGEISLWRGRYRRQGLSLGCLVLRDRAGSLNYGTTSADIMASYFFPLGSRFPHFLSFAAALGYAQSGFDIANISLADDSESMPRHQSSYPILRLGVAWHCSPTEQLQLRLGLSGSNLNRPNISYLQLDDTHLEPRWNLYSQVEYRCWESVALAPVAFFQLQHNNDEFLFGTDVKWFLDESSSHWVVLSAGLLFRHRDAFTVNLLAELNAFAFSFSYDANVSKLVEASNTIGAFELGLLYRFSKHKKQNHHSLPCPIM